jgi:hypothetical protein
MWLTAILLAAVVHSNVNPTPRRLGAFYFNGPDESQIWVDLEAQPVAKDDPPVRMNFTVKFKGRELRATPKVVAIRAGAGIYDAPTHVRVPVLQLHLADDTVFDLTAPGAPYGFVSSMPCHNADGNTAGCTADTIVSDMKFSDVEHLVATSSYVLVDALGFQVRLVPEDVAAIRALVEAVRDGAVVK